jgi:hypothetical protein
MSSQDQSQDQQADAEEPDAEVDEQQAASASPAPGQGDGEDDERIAEITERIDKARSRAEDAGVVLDTDEEHFADSGATESEDDQTIAPPG